MWLRVPKEHASADGHLDGRALGPGAPCFDADGLEIFETAQNEATPEQWRGWLRVPLEYAAAAGNFLELFTRLMDAGADGSPGGLGSHGRTLVGAAAAGRNEEIVLALLQAGANPEVDFIMSAKTELGVALPVDRTLCFISPPTPGMTGS